MNESPKTDKNNITHLKKYTESYYNKISDDSDKSDSKFIGIIGFSILSLKFADDLSGNTSLAIALKTAACIFFLGAVICCFLGLSPQTSKTEDSRQLREEMYSDEYKDNPENFELRISDVLIQTSEEIRKVAENKAKFLHSSIVSLSFGAILIALNIILKAFTAPL